MPPQSATVFGTRGPAAVPRSPGTDLACLKGKTEIACASACAADSRCGGFQYTAQGSSGAWW